MIFIRISSHPCNRRINLEIKMKQSSLLEHQPRDPSATSSKPIFLSVHHFGGIDMHIFGQDDNHFLCTEERSRFKLLYLSLFFPHLSNNKEISRDESPIWHHVNYFQTISELHWDSIGDSEVFFTKKNPILCIILVIWSV